MKTILIAVLVIFFTTLTHAEDSSPSTQTTNQAPSGTCYGTCN